jgi:2-oxoglutarate ferredoxin oxidoreductase subunit gamma
MVRLAEMKSGARVYSVPATRLAEELGRRMVLNIVMVGFFAAITGLLTRESLRKAVGDSVPPATRELNLSAFDKGFDYGRAKLTPSLPPSGKTAQLPDSPTA